MVGVVEDDGLGSLGWGWVAVMIVVTMKGMNAVASYARWSMIVHVWQASPARQDNLRASYEEAKGDMSFTEEAYIAEF